MSDPVSRPTSPPDLSLSAALAQLSAVAGAAGKAPETARAEGERLAAAVAEAATGAAADWNAETGHTGTQDFFDAASAGRRWRASPTALLSLLLAESSAQSAPYAEALAAVCVAASRLGTPSARLLGNASVAASSQLNAVRAPVPSSSAGTQAPPEVERSPEPPAARPAPSEPAISGLLDVLQQTQQRLADLTGLSRGLGRSDRTPSVGSTFDLPPTADLPGAFPGLGHRPGAAEAPPRDADGVPLTGDSAASPSDTTPTDTFSTTTAAPVEAPPPAVATPEPEPKSLEELMAELDALIGLADVKAEIHRQVAILRVEQLRTKAGLRSPTITRHLVFVGNPGTGKTTVARLVGGIYRALGLLSKGQLVEVDRAELVAGFLGQTAIKTSEVVASAVGGVLFIDEAYSLAGDQYGTEAVDTLVKEMEDHRDDLVLIVAGYPDPMVAFIAQNPGLSSRFRTTIEFADYSDDELVEIFTTLARAADYDVTPGCLSRFRTHVSVTPRGPTFGNGRFARNQLEAAIGRHAWRLRDVDEPTLEQLRELVADDLDAEQTSTDDHSRADDETTEPRPADALLADAPPTDPLPRGIRPSDPLPTEPLPDRLPPDDPQPGVADKDPA